MSIQSEWNGLNTIDLFKEFYVRVHSVKKMITQGVIDWNVISVEEIKPDISEREATEMLAAYLKATLKNQMEYVSSNASALEFAAYKEACYLMSALADEIFLLQIKWFGAKYWNEHSVEFGVFSTSYAGDEYYQRLSKLLNKEVLTGLEKKLATVFLMTLQLGFRGRYRGNEKAVHELRKKLLPKTGYTSKDFRYLFPFAYGSVKNPPIAQKLEPFSGWHQFLFWSFVFYLLISSGIWWWLTDTFSRELLKL